MSNRPTEGRAAPGAYPGGELSLFQQAVNWKRYLRAQLGGYARGRVLDVGSGIGGTIEHLLDGRQTSCTCLEPDPALAFALRSRLGAAVHGVPLDVIVGTLDALPAESRFDTILYVDVLEHLDDDRGELARAAAHLEAGGALVVLAPAYPWLFSAFDEQVGHRRRYVRRSLAAVGPPGLTLERAWHLDAAGLLASLANRALLAQTLPTPRQVRLWDCILVPVSRVLDPLLLYRSGRSVIAAWRRDKA